jgi:hypothetical protein
MQNSRPMIVSVEMGYGHLRAAHTLAELFGTEVVRMDVPPIAGPVETAVWRGILGLYKGISKACDRPIVGPAAGLILENVTGIAPIRTQAAKKPPTLITRIVDSLSRTVVGRRLRAIASRAEGPILATFPAAAMAASRAPGARVFCLATDTDLNRAWAPSDAAHPRMHFLAPVKRVAERLRSFGVPDHQIHVTGFPLPAKLVDQAQAALARRLHRLDPQSVFRNQAYDNVAGLAWSAASPSWLEPITMTIAIGGAGAQTRHAGQILRSLRSRVLEAKLRLTLVAGVLQDVAGILHGMVHSAGLACCLHSGIEILLASDVKDYFRSFDDCLAETDLLWTKPSELVFYAALGLPLLLAPPVGGQEHANRDWLLAHESALDARDPTALDQQLDDLLVTGKLCRIAANSYSRLDRNGSNRIFEVVSADGFPNKDYSNQCPTVV